MPWWVLIVGLIPLLASGLILHAGRLESRGKLGSARRLVRRGGHWMALGCAIQASAGLLISWPAAGLIGTAGFVGLLAGLSGKPRPSGWFAVLLLLTGQLLLVAGTATR